MTRAPARKPPTAPRPTAAPRPALPSWLPLLALLLTVGTSHLLAIRDLRALPSPLFGGDLYYQMGCIRSIRASGDPMASCSTSGALPGYLPLYGAIVAGFSLATGGDALGAMLALDVVLAMLAVLIVALAIGRIFGRATGIVAAALWFALHPGPLLRYTDFAAGIVVPLAMLALVLALAEPRMSRAIVLGLALAACGYAHAVAFLGLVAIAIIGIKLEALLRRDGAPLVRRLGGAALRAGVVLALAGLALGYWWKPLAQYHGRTSAHYTQWNGGPSLVTLGERLAYARDILFAQVRLDGGVETLVSLLVIAGALVVARRRDARSGGEVSEPARERPRLGTLGIVAATTFLFGFHFFLTQPLLGINLIPDYLFALLWGFARFLLAGAAIAAVLAAVRARAPVLALGLVWASIAVAVLAGRSLVADESLARARVPLDRMYAGLETFVAANTRPNDVFLSTNELSFALSALTGRKVLVTRRAQNDAFIDMDVRNKDAALILYGRDAAARARLLEHYRVSYLLWTDEWASTEFYFDERGAVKDYDDPLLYFQNPAYDAELDQAGVAFTHRLGWVDPSLRGENHRRFPLTIVTPDNYTRPDRPWRPELDPLLEAVWVYREAGRVVAAIYRVRG